jgi:Domain of unknown function (DUF1877)
MSVNRYLLPITDAELTSLLQTPKRVFDLVEERNTDVRELGTDAVAIVVLTAESADDPLAFMCEGAPENVGGWIGDYAEEDGEVVVCDIDTGDGPPSYFRNEFLQQVAQRLELITSVDFAANCDLDLPEDNDIYPTGWHDEGRKDELIESFNVYRECILSTAESGRHLLSWCA